MHWKNWLKLIGAALLVWILISVDWQQATQSLLKLNSTYLMGYVLCFAAMMLVRILRLQVALSRLGYSISFRDCYVAILEPAFMGIVTPGRMGEFTRVGYIHANGVPLQEAVSVVIVERLIDIGVLLIFSVVGMTYIFAPIPYQFSSELVLMLGLLLIFGVIRGYDFLIFYLQKYGGWIMLWEPVFLARHRQAMAISFHGAMNRAAMPIFLLGLVCIALNFGQVYLLAMAFGFEADYWMVIFAYAAATLVSLLPISVGGLGTRETTYIMIMAGEGISKESALLFSLLDGLIFGILMLLVLLIPVWVCRILPRYFGLEKMK
ncbi:lysylphosphatidylglycerol synthase transmembrane domain-containing protein [Polynucleobacter sp.]|uniref:lysylphosphatidylglycerol synthase transmembrane domain-containing protein n=1 Tax=Polynucleobacter sp. TaxID=2029855 RepID=UPI003F6991D0